MSLLLTFYFSHAAQAEDYTRSTPMPVLADRPDKSALADADRQVRLDALKNFVRHDLPNLLPGLPSAVREPAGFIARQFKGIEDSLDEEEDSGSSGGSSFASFFAPVFSLMRPGEESDTEAVWVTPGYHHAHGVLPFDDALVFGFNYRNTALHDRLKFSMHPYYAQSWNSGAGYWGTEFALGIGPGDGRSWGTLVVRYTNGNTDIMDGNRHGMDMHADFKFEQGWSFAAGAQSNEEGDLGNYAVVRWSMKIGE